MTTGGTILLIIITLIFPPAGAAIVAGCGPDLLINIALTILGYIPGHVHAFYLLYVYHERHEASLAGRLNDTPAPGIYSDRVQSGGHGYGTIVQQN